MSHLERSSRDAVLPDVRSGLAGVRRRPRLLLGGHRLQLRVDGQPVHFSATDWKIEHGAPCLSEHTEDVLTSVLGLSREEVATLRQEGVV